MGRFARIGGTRYRLRPPPAADPTVMPVGNLPGWTQVVADDFNYNYPVGSIVTDQNGALVSSSPAYAELGSKFTFYPDGWNSTWGGKTGRDASAPLSTDPAVTVNAKWYPSKTVSFANSCATIYHHSESIGGVMTALGSTLKPINPAAGHPYKFDPYLRWSFRMRSRGINVPNGTRSYFNWVPLGIDSANWPSNGEIDFPEGDIAYPIAGNYHPAASTNQTYHYTFGGLAPTDWHVYTMEWTPGRMKWSVDGVTYMDTTDRVPSGPMAFLFQHETDDWQPLASTVGYVDIDWITIYTYTP